MTKFKHKCFQLCVCCEFSGNSAVSQWEHQTRGAHFEKDGEEEWEEQAGEEDVFAAGVRTLMVSWEQQEERERKSRFTQIIVMS